MIVLREIVSWCWLSLKRFLSAPGTDLRCFGTLHYVVELLSKVKVAMRLKWSFLHSGGQSASVLQKTEQTLINLLVTFL
jgi:hypothetical protein